MASVPTVRVRNPKGEGFVNVNREDFEAGGHELWSDEAVTPKAVEPVAPPDTTEKPAPKPAKKTNK